MTQLAKQLKVSPQLMSRWASGNRHPSLEMLVKLEGLLGISVRDWAERVGPPDRPHDTQPVDFRPGDTHEDLKPPFDEDTSDATV